MTSFSEEAEPGDGARADPPYHSAFAAPPTDNRIRENVKLNYDLYMVIDIDEVHLPEGNLNLAHGVVLGDGVLVNNLRGMIIREMKNLIFTWRTTVLV